MPPAHSEGPLERLTIRTLHVADIELPPSLERLRDLAYDYWWSWSPRANRLFSRIDPEPWRRYHNPVQLLINVEPQQWMRLLSDPEFVRLYGDVIQALDEYRRAAALVRPAERLARRAGRLLLDGVRDPRVARDLLGRPRRPGRRPLQGGERPRACRSWAWGCSTAPATSARRWTPTASSSTPTPNYDFARLPGAAGAGPGRRRADRADRPAGRVVHAAVWKVQVGLVPVLMLDTDIPLNDPADRPITGSLYVRGREMRLCQEIVLGVGGVRALRALGIHPAVWHMNEGHVAFLALERARERVQTRRQPGRGARRGEGRPPSSPPTRRCRRATRPSTRKLVRRYLEPWSATSAASPTRRSRSAPTTATST